MSQEATGRVVVVRAGGLGDTILVLPALQRLRARFPAARMTLVGSHWAEDLLPLVPFPCAVVRFDSPVLTPLFGPSPEADPLGVFSSADAAILYAASPDEDFVRNARRFCRGRVVVWPVAPEPGVHAADHFAAAVDDAGPRLPGPGGVDDSALLRVEHELAVRAGVWMRDRLGSGPCDPGAPPGSAGAHDRRPALPRGNGVSAVAVHPGSGGRRKCWPAERFAEVVAGIGRPVVLIEGPADAEACRGVRDLVSPVLPVARAEGLLVPQAASLIAACGLFLGNDSGMSHLAAALGVPTVAVFGPTDPAVWSPRGRTVQVVGGGGGWPGVDAVRDAAAKIAAFSGREI